MASLSGRIVRAYPPSVGDIKRLPNGRRFSHELAANHELSFCCVVGQVESPSFKSEAARSSPTGSEVSEIKASRDPTQAR